MKPNRKNPLLAVFISLTLTAPAVLAADINGAWNADSDGNWSDSTKWTLGDVADGVGFTATLGDVITANRIITLDSARSIGNITALDATHDYTVSGSILTLDASVVSIIDVPASRTLFLNSDVSGNDPITKQGDGTLSLGGNNNFSGAITVTAGTLAPTSNTALGTTAGNTTVNGGNLSTGFNLSLSNATTDLTLGENISLSANASGRANLLNNSIQSHTLNGNIDVTSDTNAAQIFSTNNAGSITINGNINGTFINGASFLIRGGSTNTNNRILGDINITGGNFTKTDNGTWLVGSPLKNYIWGDTRVAVGTLMLGKANIVAGTGGLVLGNSTGTSSPKLDLNGFSQVYSGLTYNGATTEGLRTVTNDSVTAAVLTINNSANISPVGLGGLAANSVVLTGNLGLIKDGIGNLTLSGVNTYTGATTITAGALILNNANPLGTIPGTNGTVSIALAAGATLRDNFVGGTANVYAPITLSGTGNATIMAGGGTGTATDTNIAGAIGGSVTSGSLVFTTVSASQNNNFPVITLGSTGTYTCNTIITTANGNNNLTVKSGALNSLDPDTVLTLNGGAASNSAAGRKVEFDLNGNNQTLAGLTNSTVDHATSRNQRVNNSGTLATLTINNSTDFSYGGQTTDAEGTGSARITGAIALTKSGAGTLTLGGTLGGTATTANALGNTFTGDTKILGGILVLDVTNSIQNSAFDTGGSLLGTAASGLRTTVTALTLGGLTGSNSFASRFTTTAGGYSGVTALTLNPGNGATPSYSGNITDGAVGMTLTKSGAGIQTLSGTNTYTGATQVNGGILNFASKAARPSAVTAAAAGSVGLGVSASDAAYYSATDVANMFNTNSLANYSLDPASGVAIDTTNSGGSFDQSVALTTARALTKLGTNTLRLTTNNTFTGGVTIIAGNLELGNAGALNSTAGSENSVTFGAATTGSLTLAGNSVVISSLNSNATPGTPIVQNANGSPVSNATLTVGNSQNLASTFAGVIQNGSGGGTLALTKVGTNTLTLSGANTYTGATAINAGTLTLSNVSALGGNSPGVNGTSAISMVAGTFLRSQITGATVSAPITLSGTGNASIIIGAGGTQVFNVNGAIGGVDPLTNMVFSTGASAYSNANHTIILGTASTYAGNTTITTGGSTANRLTVKVGAGIVNALPVTTVLTMDGLTGEGTGRGLDFDLNGNNQTLAGLTNVTGLSLRRQTVTNSGALATLTINNTANFSYGGAVTTGPSTTSAQITGAIALTKSGAGTFTLAAGATNTYTGDTTVTAGVLAVTGTSIPNTGKLVIAGGKVDLTNTETVNTLFFGGVQQEAGNYTSADLSTNFTGSGTLTVLNGPGYASWASLNGASLTNLSEDHDNDGVDNGTEYFIGGPTGLTTGFTPLPGVTNTAGVLSVTWTKSANYTGTYGTDFVVETSATLTGVWAPEPSPGTVAISATTVTYTFPAGTINFARLKVTGP